MTCPQIHTFILYWYKTIILTTVIHQHGEIGFSPLFSQKQMYPSCILSNMQRVQDFLKHIIRETIYPKEILHGGAKYPRILYTGVPRMGDAIYSVTPEQLFVKSKEIQSIFQKALVSAALPSRRASSKSLEEMLWLRKFCG